MCDCNLYLQILFLFCFEMSNDHRFFVSEIIKYYSQNLPEPSLWVLVISSYYNRPVLLKISTVGWGVGHSLKYIQCISEVRQWLPLDITYIKPLFFWSFFPRTQTASKFKFFCNCENRFWTIENHRFSLNIHSKHIKIEFLSCCRLL